MSLKPVLVLLLSLLLSASAAPAKPRHPRQAARAATRPAGCHVWGAIDTEVAAPAPTGAPVELRARAAQATAYYTSVLRLNYAQSRAVARATRQLLLDQGQGQGQALPGAAARYDTALLRVLRPGQYSAFRFLEDRQPAEDAPVTAAH